MHKVYATRLILRLEFRANRLVSDDRIYPRKDLSLKQLENKRERSHNSPFIICNCSDGSSYTGFSCLFCRGSVSVYQVLRRIANFETVY